MIIKANLEIRKVKRAEEMNKNLLWLINVIQGFESELLEYKGYGEGF